MRRQVGRGGEWDERQREGLRDQARRQFRLSSACGRKSCQRLGGKVVREAEKMAIKWFLAFRIARSAGRTQWL